MPLHQKTVTHRPQIKVLEFLAALLSGLPYLKDLSCAAHPLDQDREVARAWGQPAWADYSGVSRSMDPLVSTVTYTPGQVRMGATWNRYGDPSGSLGGDWPRTLAHELGHFLLHLDDNYLGPDEEGLLVTVDTCPGAMSDPYRGDLPYDEFHPNEGWLPDCEQTLSHRTTSRSDWGTITALYPELNDSQDNPGPATLPLAVTEVTFVEPLTPTETLEVPTFSLAHDGSRVVPGASARAFLSQEERLIDLGRPTLDRLLARGARPGDRLCVYEPAAGRLGCEMVDPPDQQLDLYDVSGWQPEVTVTPVTSRTLSLAVSNVQPGLSLSARLYPMNYPAPPPIALEESGEEYNGTFHLDEPTFEGHVQVWVEEGEPQRELVVDYALGGNPGHVWSRRAPRGSPGHVWSRRAPVISADGQVILYGPDLDFEEGEFFALQSATLLPSVPSWATVVGQGYRLSATASAPDLSGTSVSFGYLGSEVSAGEEDWLRVYFWDEASWQQLPTELDPYHNVASASTQGPGLYALMSSLEIPLYGPGWNLFAYPVQATRPVAEALDSLDGFYTTVYGWEAQDQEDPWKMYDVTVPDWVNDLEVLAFGYGYWITVTQDITLYLRGAADTLQAAEVGLQSPPATYYGEVLPGPGLWPTPGMAVTAWIDGHLCGQSETMEADSQVGYSINVFAEGAGGWAGCGAPGMIVTFHVDSLPMVPTAMWNNSRVWELPLRPLAQEHIYLPLVVKTR